MKSKFLKFAGALMIVASATALSFSANGQLYPEEDCDTYCQYSNSFDCLLTYTSGGTQTCYYNKPNGTIEQD